MIPNPVVEPRLTEITFSRQPALACMDYANSRFRRREQIGRCLHLGHGTSSTKQTTGASASCSKVSFHPAMITLVPSLAHWLIDFLRDRTHRQRTQNYIKTLESEVVRLRGSETSLMEEKERLQVQIDTLRATITFSNLPLPPGIDPLTTAEHQGLQSNAPEMATISYRNDDLSHPRLHVDWTPTPAQEVPRMNYNLGQGPVHSASSQYHDPLGGESLPNLPDGTSAWTFFD